MEWKQNEKHDLTSQNKKRLRTIVKKTRIHRVRNTKREQYEVQDIVR